MSARRYCHGDRERILWCENDKELYALYHASNVPMDVFIAQNRDKIDGIINKRLNGEQAA